MSGLLCGLMTLTADITVGIILAEVIMRLKLPELMMRIIRLKKIPQTTATAIAIATASPRLAASMISDALTHGLISARCAEWSVMMLPLPAYLRRWPSTFILSVSMAGIAGGIFACSLLMRSVMRFMIAVYMVRSEAETATMPGEFPPVKMPQLWMKLFRTLPVAWIMYAAAYVLVPVADEYLRGYFAGGFLPISGWSVSAASLGHISAALSLAGGSISAGNLSITQAVFALILGSGLGTMTRILRQDAGYYYGLFPAKLASKMLLLNFSTITPLIVLNLLFAGLALSLWP